MGGWRQSDQHMSNHGGARSRYQPISAINVTPFVDVMLVLLVVFMITAPLLTVGVPIDLPKIKAKQITENIEPIEVSVSRDGQIYIGETPIATDDLVTKLRAIAQENFDARIFVRGDRQLQYGQMVEVMGRLTLAGFRRLALIALPPVPQ